MADKKISQLTALSAANLAPSTDVLAIVDTSATETKKIVAQDLINGVLNVASAVGIGTASPGEKLNVIGGGATTSTVNFTGGAANDNATIASDYSLVFQVDANNNVGGRAFNWRYGGKGYSDGTSLMTLNSSGILLINANAPVVSGAKISVADTVDTSIQLTKAGVVAARLKAVSTALAFGVDGADGDTERARITSGGQLVVAATSGPSGSTIAAAGIIDSVSATSPAYRLLTDNTTLIGGFGSGNWAFGDGTTNVAAYAGTSKALLFGAGGSERGRFTAGGELLINTTNTSVSGGPGFKVLPSANGTDAPQVAIVTPASTSTTSSLSLYSTGAAAFRFYVVDSGTIYATTTTITGISDRRLKENIEDIDVGLEKILALKPRKFDWKEGKGKDKKGDRGWIADEFKLVFPDMVEKWLDAPPEGEDPYEAVSADLIPVLVKAIQELSAKVSALEAQ